VSGEVDRELDRAAVLDPGVSTEGAGDIRFDLLVEFDTRDGWSGHGIASCAHWLSWKAGLSQRTAQDHVRVAHALTGLPLLRSLRQIDRREDEEQQGRVESRGRWRWNDDGTLSVNLRLSPIDGARFLAGVTRAEYERTRTHDEADISPPTPNESPAEAVPASPSSRADLWRGVPTDIAEAVVTMSDTVADAIAVPEFVPGAEIVVRWVGSSGGRQARQPWSRPALGTQTAPPHASSPAGRVPA
jgi:hypothetical protein